MCRINLIPLLSSVDKESDPSRLASSLSASLSNNSSVLLAALASATEIVGADIDNGNEDEKGAFDLVTGLSGCKLFS